MNYPSFHKTNGFICWLQRDGKGDEELTEQQKDREQKRSSFFGLDSEGMVASIIHYFTFSNQMVILCTRVPGSSHIMH